MTTVVEVKLRNVIGSIAVTTSLISFLTAAIGYNYGVEQYIKRTKGRDSVRKNQMFLNNSGLVTPNNIVKNGSHDSLKITF